MASWGYVVVGSDAADTYPSVLPDGTVMNGQPFDQPGASDSQWAAIIEGRLKDLQCTMDQLAALNAAWPKWFDNYVQGN
jgi:hypothetical protein